jgi:hypothetical protein
VCSLPQAAQQQIQADIQAASSGDDSGRSGERQEQVEWSLLLSFSSYICCIHRDTQCTLCELKADDAVCGSG